MPCRALTTLPSLRNGTAQEGGQGQAEAEPDSSTSDLQEDPPPVHPEEDEPEDQQDGGAVEEGLVGGAEDLEGSRGRGGS